MRTLTKPLLAPAICLLTGLGACGGGGGGGGEGAATPAPASQTTTAAVSTDRVLLIKDTVARKPVSGQARRRAASPDPLPADTISLPVTEGTLVHVRAYAVINPFTCAYIEDGDFSVLTAPTHGDLEFTHEEVDFGGACAGKKLPAAVARYRWTDTTAVPDRPSSTDYFSLRFTTTSGGASADTRWLAFLTAPVKIRLPDGTDITHNDASPVKAVVGQRIELFGSAEGLAAGVTVAAQAWTIDGIAVGGYDVTRPTHQLQQARTNEPSVTFHWISPRSLSRTVLRARYTVQLSDGRSLSGHTAFSLVGPDVAPVAPRHAALPMTRYASNPDRVALGSVNNPSDAGIVVDHPAIAPPDEPGWSLWVQILAKDHVAQRGATTESVCDVGPDVLDLDQAFPTRYGRLWDSPAMPAAGNLSLARDFSARAYAMWQPMLPGSIPVPLGYVDWSFTHIAVRDTPSEPWLARVYDYRASPFQESLAFPQWTRVVKYGELGCNPR